jgi:Flp pilus assembly protein TadG
MDKARRARRRGRVPRVWDERGNVSAFIVVLVLALVAVAGLVLDCGLALSTKTQALDTAQAAARAGASQLDVGAYRASGVVRLDPGRAQAAARAWLARAGATGEVTATTTEVTVTVHATRNTSLLRLVGVAQLQVSATSAAQPRHGVSTAEPN